MQGDFLMVDGITLSNIFGVLYLENFHSLAELVAQEYWLPDSSIGLCFRELNI